MIATTAPTGASIPSLTLISASVPATVAGTSIDVLSVSISNRSSPGATLSPTFLNQVVILPDVTVSPSCGINTSIAHPAPSAVRRSAFFSTITMPSLPSEATTHGRRDPLLIGQDDVLEGVGRRQGHMRRGDAHRRAVEIVESLVGYDRHDLRAPATQPWVLLDREHPIGACDRLEDGPRVEGHQGADIDHLAIDA